MNIIILLTKILIQNTNFQTNPRRKIKFKLNTKYIE